MSLVLGELSTILKTDNTQFEQGLKDSEQKFHGTGEKLKAGAAIVGAAVGAALAAGLAGAIDADRAKAKLSAQLGGDAEYAAGMGRVAGKVYARGFGQNLDEINNALRGVLSSGLIDEDAADADIERVTVKAQALAQVFDQDVGQAARAAGQMVRTGLAANADQAFDILTRGMQQTGDQAGDLLDTFSEYSTQFREVGISGPKAMGLLNQAVRAGARDLDTAADAIKEFAIRSQDGSKTSAAAFNALNLNAKDMTATFAKGGPAADKAMKLVIDRLNAMKDPVEQRATAIALFGTKAEDLGDALYALDPSTAVAGLGDVAGAADKLGKTLEQSASQKLDAFKRQVQSALVEKVGMALPYLENLGKFASDNSTALLTLGGVIVGLAATVMLVNGAMAAWNAIQIIWTGITKGAAAAQWLLNAAMYASPIGLVVLAVIALVAGIYLLWTHSAAFRDFFIGMWEGISSFFVFLFQKWWALFSGFWSAVFSGVSAGWKWVVDKVSGFIDFVGSLPKKIGAKARGMFDGIKDAFRSAVNWIIGKWNGLQLTIGGGSILGKNIPSVTLGTPNLPMLAAGGTALAPGMAIVGERGPELAYMNRGATIRPLDGRGGGGGGGVATIRLIVSYPDGRVIRDEIVNAADLRGQTPGQFLSVAP